MRRFYHSLLSLCIALLCIFFVPSRAQAANYTPGQVKSLKATAGESKVVLKWKTVSKATGYYIYCFDSQTEQFKRIGYTKNANYTVKNLTNNMSYAFKVSAYRVKNSQTYIGDLSKEVTATPMVDKPAKPKPYLASCANQSATLKWDKINGATGYQIFQKNSSGNFVSIGKIKGTSVSISNLNNDVEYYFKVRAYRKVKGAVRYSKYSSVVKAKPLSVSSEIKSIQTMYYKATLNATVYAPVISKSKVTSTKVKITSGTTVTVTSRSTSECIVQLKNGKKAVVNRSNLSFNSCVYNSKFDYSDAAKEGFVNSKGYYSSTGYLIWISLYRQKVYLFKGTKKHWKLFKTYPCSTGTAQDATPSGTFSLYQKAERCVFDQYSYADYACYFCGSALHSWLKYRANGQPVPGSLGSPASHGCVRLRTDDIYYIYHNVPMSTTIIIY